MASNSQVEAFQAKFSAFASTDEADIAEAIDTASIMVGDQTQWSSTDYALAVLYYAAHFLSLQEIEAASSQLAGPGESDIFVRQISFGERRISFEQRNLAKTGTQTTGPGESMLEDTIYGQLYLQLRSRNIVGVASI